MRIFKLRLEYLAKLSALYHLSRRAEALRLSQGLTAGKASSRFSLSLNYPFAVLAIERKRLFAKYVIARLHCRDCYFRVSLILYGYRYRVEASVLQHFLIVGVIGTTEGVCPIHCATLYHVADGDEKAKIDPNDPEALKAALEKLQNKTEE